MHKKPAIAFLGTGLMGDPMIRVLAKGGFPLHIWNRTPSKMEKLADVAHIAKTPADAVASAEFVITMVTDSAAVTEILVGEYQAIPHAPAGAIFIDMSSIAPPDARKIADFATRSGRYFLDAPVSGGVQGAQKGSLAIMVGGAPQIFARAETVLRHMGAAHLIGPHGSGQTAKLVNQAIVGITIGAVAEGLFLAEQAGCDGHKVRQALLSGFAQSPILQHHGQKMLARDWRPGGRSKLQLKDLRNVAALADSYGLTLPFCRQAHLSYETLVNKMDGGDLDHSALFFLLAQQHGKDDKK